MYKREGCLYTLHVPGTCAILAIRRTSSSRGKRRGRGSDCFADLIQALMPSKEQDESIGRVLLLWS
jgi:hypothetical protein